MNTAVWKKLSLAAAFTLVSSAVAAQQQCNQRDNVLGHLAQTYREAPVAFGVTNKGRLIEVFSTRDGDTWTIVVSAPDGTSCLVAAGEGWRTKPHGNALSDPEA